MALKRIYQALMGLSLTVLASFGAGSVVGTVALTANAVQYTENELVLKDFEGMQMLVQKIKNQDLHMDDVDEARKIKAKDALNVVFARRDGDGSRSKLYRMIFSDLEDEDMNEVLDGVIDDAISGAQDVHAPIAQRSTNFMILQNFMNEMKPFAAKHKALFAKIRDARIEVTDELVKFRRLKSTAAIESPSTYAEVLIGKKG